MGALLDVLAAGLPQPDADRPGARRCAAGDADRTVPRRRIAADTGNAPAASLPVEHDSELEASGGGVVNTDAWHISIRFGPGVLRNGMDPLSFLRYLEFLGEIIAITTLADAMPAGRDGPRVLLPRLRDPLPDARFQGADRTGLRLRARRLRRCASCRRTPRSRIPQADQRTARGQHAPRRNPRPLRRPDAGRTRRRACRCSAQSRHRREADGEDSRSPPLGDILVDQKVVHKEIVEAAANRQHRRQREEGASKRAWCACTPTSSTS
jgi:two-component system chemotaxis sensor kinase CheA